MTTNDSESDLAGKLGASLTPRVPRITIQQRGEQNSGLFDIGALYAESVEQVMRRARTGREQPPPVLGVAAAARPVPESPPNPWAGAPARHQLLALDIDPGLEPVVPAPGRGSFGIVVAWLATAVIGATVATTLVAHTVARGRASTPAVVAAAPTAVAMPATALAAIPASPPPALPSLPAPPAPFVAVKAVAPVSEPALAPLPKKAGGAAHFRTRHVVRSAPADAPAQAAPTPVSETAAPTAEEPPPKAAAPSPAPAAPSPAPVAAPASGGASLEEMMRRAVEADAKKH